MEIALAVLALCLMGVAYVVGLHNGQTEARFAARELERALSDFAVERQFFQDAQRQHAKDLTYIAVTAKGGDPVAAVKAQAISDAATLDEPGDSIVLTDEEQAMIEDGEEVPDRKSNAALFAQHSSFARGGD